MRVTLTAKADKPVALISGWKWNLECWSLWREENLRTQRKTLEARTRTNNKLSPHMTPGSGIEPGPHWWETSSLTAACAIPASPSASQLKAFAFLNPCPKLIYIMIWVTIKRIPQIPVNTCVRSKVPKCTQKSLRERSPPSWFSTNPVLMPNNSQDKSDERRIPHILRTQRAANMVMKPH